MELKVEKLNKIYGDNHALKNFTYTFNDGIYGLLGPNGAGKSTLINCITRSQNYTSGNVFYNGENISVLGKNYNSIIGYMPQQQMLYNDFSLEMFMSYIAALKGIKRYDVEKQVDKILRMVNLFEYKKKKIGTFSGGMKQRVLIAQAVLGNPSIMILDEPTAGLDPRERIRIRNLISELSLNKIVIIATHIVNDIEFIAKDFLIMNEGELISNGNINEICSALESNVYQGIIDYDELNVIKSKYLVSGLKQISDKIEIRIIAQKMDVLENFKCVKPCLDDVYLYYFGENIS